MVFYVEIVWNTKMINDLWLQKLAQFYACIYTYLHRKPEQ